VQLGRREIARLLQNKRQFNTFILKQALLGKRTNNLKLKIRHRTHALHWRLFAHLRLAAPNLKLYDSILAIVNSFHAPSRCKVPLEKIKLVVNQKITHRPTEERSFVETLPKNTNSIHFQKC